MKFRGRLPYQLCHPAPSPLSRQRAYSTRAGCGAARCHTGTTALASAGTRRADPVRPDSARHPRVAVERAPLRVPSKGTSAAPASERPRDLAQCETGPESFTEMHVSVLDVNCMFVQRRRSVRGTLGSTARARGRFHREGRRWPGRQNSADTSADSSTCSE